MRKLLFICLIMILIVTGCRSNEDDIHGAGIGLGYLEGQEETDILVEDETKAVITESKEEVSRSARPNRVLETDETSIITKRGVIPLEFVARSTLEGFIFDEDVEVSEGDRVVFRVMDNEGAMHLQAGIVTSSTHSDGQTVITAEEPEHGIYSFAQSISSSDTEGTNRIPLVLDEVEVTEAIVQEVLFDEVVSDEREELTLGEDYEGSSFIIKTRDHVRNRSVQTPDDVYYLVEVLVTFINTGDTPLSFKDAGKMIMVQGGEELPLISLPFGELDSALLSKEVSPGESLDFSLGFEGDVNSEYELYFSPVR